MSALSFPELPARQAALIRDLLGDKKAREAQRAFVLEGRKPILELLRINASSLLEVIVTRKGLEQADVRVSQALEQAKVPVHLCREQTFEHLSAVMTAQGILAVIRKTDWDEEAIFRRPLILGLVGESLQDPTNVGAIVRTALAFGLDGVWLTADSADVYNPKVVRATAGAIMKLPIFVGTSGETLAARFHQEHCALLASDPSRKRTVSIREIQTIPSRAMLAFGNESRGLSKTILDRANMTFHIPVHGVESLNVAASAAIALYHFSALPREAN